MFYFFGAAAGAGVEAAGFSVSFFFFSGFRLSPNGFSYFLPEWLTGRKLARWLLGRGIDGSSGAPERQTGRREAEPLF